MMTAKARFVEIAPGEWRTVCHGCGRVLGYISPRLRWCDECKATKGHRCQLCGKPSGVDICRSCQSQSPTIVTDALRPVMEGLWAKGFTAKDIAKKLGVRTNHPGTMISKARKRGWVLPHRRPDNIETGHRIAAMSNAKRGGASSRKRRLEGVQELAERERGKKVQSDSLRSAVERMWAEDFTAREICDNLGWSTAHPGAAMTKCRRRGWNLPYRIPGLVPKAREGITAVNDRRASC